MYKNLKRELRERRLKIVDVARILDVPYDETLKKINKGLLLAQEAAIIHQKMFPDIRFEYLFRNEKELKK